MMIKGIKGHKSMCATLSPLGRYKWQLPRLYGVIAYIFPLWHSHAHLQKAEWTALSMVVMDNHTYRHELVQTEVLHR